MSDRASRGQSEPIGTALILAVSITVMLVSVGLGAAVLSDATSGAETDRMENTMSQFSSKASLAALGEADSKRVSLGSVDDGQMSVREDAGRVTVVHDPEDADPVELSNSSLGAVVYENDGTEIAMQGGGVWRKTDDWSGMLSPPEYHYQRNTLTLPIVRVTGEGGSSGATDATVTRGDSEQVFPTEEHPNPLQNGTVYVKVQSDYYEGWYEFFDSRSDGEVVKYDENRTVVVDLEVPFDEEIDSIVATTDEDGITANPGNGPDPSKSGVNYPSADSKVESEIEACEANDCDDFFDAVDDGTLTAGTYYADSHAHLNDDFTVDTSDGNVTIVVNGDFSPETIDVDGDNQVTVYVRNNFNFGGSSTINEDGDAGNYRTVVHSDGNVDMNGGFQYVGVVYAPNSHVNVNGGGGPNLVNIKGAIISETLNINGNPNKFEYDASAAEVSFDLDQEQQDFLTYLHITENEIRVELG